MKACTASYWPKQTDNNPFTDRLNNMPKYVVSTTLTEPLAWQNTTLIKGNLTEAVTALKAQPGNDLVVMASSKLTQSLMKLNLIDRYVLMIHPLVLGTGQRLFDCLKNRAHWKKLPVSPRTGLYSTSPKQNEDIGSLS